MATRSLTRRVVSLLLFGLVATLVLTGPATGTVFVRDPNYNGIWQDWGGGWQYAYWATGDYAWWRLNGNNRLEYQYTNQQWWDCDKFGTWRALGANGVTDSWIGDGA